MKTTFIFTLSLLLAGHSLYGSDNEKEVPMTPQIFFDTIFNDPDEPEGWSEKEVAKHSTRINLSLFEKAQKDDIDAMFELADISREDEDAPLLVPMYWFSSISRLIGKAKHPDERDLKRKKLAELELLDIQETELKRRADASAMLLPMYEQLQELKDAL